MEEYASVAVRLSSNAKNSVEKTCEDEVGELREVFFYKPSNPGPLRTSPAVLPSSAARVWRSKADLAM